MTDSCIIQFGTSRFLQAHVDLFASEARAAGEAVPPIVVVQTSGDPARAGRVAALGSAAGYPVVVRGLDSSGQAVDTTVTVTSVSRGLSAGRDWAELVALFAAKATTVVSNVGDSGYAVDDADRTPAILGAATAPRSFPAILLALLHARWVAGGTAITLLPCELVRRNGDTLKRIVGDLAAQVGAQDAFRAWLDRDCLWVNSLVDRIVSEPIEPVGAVAEPYALWAIERQPGLAMPFTHPDVVLTDDLERYERLKLHVLNLAHTWLAQRWIDWGRPEGLSVRAALEDAETAAALHRLFAEEVEPGFAAHGLAAEASAYVRETQARFRNPFLDHRLADIAQGHDAKIAKRVTEFIRWVGAAEQSPVLPELKALAGAGQQTEA